MKCSSALKCFAPKDPGPYGPTRTFILTQTTAKHRKSWFFDDKSRISRQLKMKVYAFESPSEVLQFDSSQCDFVSPTTNRNANHQKNLNLCHSFGHFEYFQAVLSTHDGYSLRWFIWNLDRGKKIKNWESCSCSNITLTCPHRHPQKCQ